MLSLYTSLITRTILVLGGLSMLPKAFTGSDALSMIKQPMLSKFLYLLVGLSAIYLIFDRDYYLPFLGKCVMPISSEGPKGELKEIKLKNLPRNTKVVAWGAKESDGVIENPYDAYSNYSNTSVSITDDNGEVTVNLECPSEYKVGNLMKKKLKRHIHYRYEIPEYKGLYSRIYTKYLDENCQ